VPACGLNPEWLFGTAHFAQRRVQAGLGLLPLSLFGRLLYGPYHEVVWEDHALPHQSRRKKPSEMPLKLAKGKVEAGEKGR
jgi:hypothetical protein